MLYEHNQQAYTALEQMLECSSRAAIVHPTGTGKAFIGLKFSEKHPNSRICWLSPSEYIYKTQSSNYQKAEGVVPANITYFTYAKLAMMTAKEMQQIAPNYIVLDEFHRCGAETWGQGVQRLLEMYSNAKVIGLSATAIRYLDNQRNMADELFDGQIASEMTLGEAIVRGILSPPKYVLSVFSYQKDIKKLQKRICSAKSQEVHERAENVIESLRRELEKADGLDVLFDKHMEERQGKYLVFCSNVEHLREMRSMASAWFSRIDKEPHIYSVYADNSEAEEVFTSFSQDHSNHLKLLYCVDMLNEGVHVSDVSGVILLRPTISPIVYKQQIGRAMAAFHGKVPVIFDIVNNIENLYSIETLQDEVNSAVVYYRSLGLEHYIVNERFTIIDELKDCRSLFEKLNETLSASWEYMYARAKQYYQENGNLNVPRRFRTEDGYSLGVWLQTQRMVRNGSQYGSLSPERIKLLDDIGMRWESAKDQAWSRYYHAAVEYSHKYGNLNAPAQYVSPDGVRLGAWLSRLRASGKSNSEAMHLTSERIEQLDALGMVWDGLDYLWERNYLAAAEYFREHRDLAVPFDYVTRDGTRLGAWIQKIRQIHSGKYRGRSLTDLQIARLNEIGMIWNGRNASASANALEAAREYYREHGNLDVPLAYKTSTGFALGQWLARCRSTEGNTPRHKVTDKEKKELDRLGMVWRKEDPWEKRFALAKRYYEEHGHLRVPASVSIDGVNLNKWLNEQKQVLMGKRPGKVLSEEQQGRLRRIGFNVKPSQSQSKTV